MLKTIYWKQKLCFYALWHWYKLKIIYQQHYFTKTWHITVVHAIVGIGRVEPWTIIIINISTIVLLGRVQFIFGVKNKLLLSFNKHLRHLNEHYIILQSFFQYAGRLWLLIFSLSFKPLFVILCRRLLEILEQLKWTERSWMI